MQPNIKLCSIALPAFLLIHHQAQASLNLNLTVTFSPDSQGNCATSNDTSQGITFSTEGITQRPMIAQCFNLDEAFTGNSTGSRNLTSSYYFSPALYPNHPSVIFSWNTTNKSSFNPGANYSRVWYQQTNDGNVMSSFGEVGDGGMQLLRVFSDPDCRHTSEPKSYTDVWSCLTDIPGACKMVPYNVKSFQIAVGPGKDGECTIPKSAGCLSGIGQRGMGVIAATVATLVALIPML